MTTKPLSLCEEVAEDLARVVEGSAAPELYEHIEDCDRCRDLRHEATQALKFSRFAGSDFTLVAGLDTRVCEALDRREPQASRPAPTLVDVSRPAAPATVVPESGPRLTSKPADEQPSQAAASEPAQKGRMSDDDWARLTGRAREESGSDRPAEQSPAAGNVRPLRPRVALLAAAVAVAAGSVGVYKVATRPSTPGAEAARSPWVGDVASIARSSDSPDAALRCDSSGHNCAPLAVSDPLKPGTLVRTGRHGRVHLRMGDGSQLQLDHDSELLLRDDQPRSARLARGSVIADVAHVETAPNAKIAFPSGSLEVLGTKFVVHASPDRSSVQVARGVVRLSDEQGRSERVFAGEEGRVSASKPVSVVSSPVIAEGFTWSERSFKSDKPQPGEDASEPLRGLGELRARKPGQQEEKDGAVRLTRHSVNVRIVDGVARTEVDEVFQNDTGEELEGIFRFPMPPDAQIERLALEVNGKLEEGAFVDKEKGQAIWRGVIKNAAPTAPKPVEEIIWVPGPWRDPALLEWKRGGRFELRIFPIPAKGARRVILAYTQSIPSVGGVRRYTYPLPYDGQGKSKLEQFQLNAQVRGHDAAQGVRSSGYTLAASRADGAESLELKESGFRPSGDLVLEYGASNPEAEVSAWAYQGTAAQGDDGSPFVALALRPKLPRKAERERREHVFVVDTSRSMVGERRQRARSLVSAMVRELDESDHVQVLACDVECKAWGRGSMEAGKVAAEDADKFLAGVDADGAANLAQMVKEGRLAGEKEASGRAVSVVYVGDGGASVGATKPDHLVSEIRRVLKGSEARVTTVAIGSDADTTLLEAMARGGGGVVVPYVPGQKTSEAALSAVGAMSGVTLREAELELPAGFVSVAPSKLETIRAGSEVIVVGRMTSKVIEGEAKLRGKVGGEAFEQKYRLKVEATSDGGNAFVPRLYAATRIADLERTGGEGAKAASVDLSKRFSVASRYTSLIVLESEAMMNAFGLKRASGVPQWTGNELATATTAKRERSVGHNDSKNDDESAEESPRGESEKDSKRADKSPGRLLGPSALRDPGDLGAPATQAAPPAPAATAAKPSAGGRAMRAFDGDVVDMPFDRGPRMIPMKKVWDRKGAFFPDATAWHEREASKLISAESSLAAKPDSRKVTQDLFALYSLHNRVDRAADLADKWASRDALDIDALLARSDMAARKGDRQAALRRLASAVDVRSDDPTLQNRMADLYDRLGDRERSCAHRLALAEQRPDDTKAQVSAVRCSRAVGSVDLADRLLADLASDKRAAVLKALEASPDEASALKGDIRLEGSWEADADLDLVLVDPQGRRLSWQGGGKATVSAQEVGGLRGEKVAWSNLGAGSYVLEVVRSKAGDTTPVRGSVVVRIVGENKTVPFVLTGERTELGRVEVSYQSRLVPAW